MAPQRALWRCMMRGKEVSDGTPRATQLSVLRRDVPSRCAQRGAPEILLQTALSQGEPGSESPRLAGEAEEPGLLPRTGKCRSRTDMAGSPPGVLETIAEGKRGGAGNSPCVTGGLSSPSR